MEGGQQRHRHRTATWSRPSFLFGTHTIALVVTDSWNMSGSATFTVTVYRPPLVAPVAIAGLNQMVRDENESGFATVQLDGSASYDPSDPSASSLTPGALRAKSWPPSSAPPCNSPVGEHHLELTVIDDDNLSDTRHRYHHRPACPHRPAHDHRPSPANNGKHRRPRAMAASIGMVPARYLHRRPAQRAQSALRPHPSKSRTPFEYVNDNRGANITRQVMGVRVPNTIMRNFIATNYDNQRDGYASFNLLGLAGTRTACASLSSLSPPTFTTPPTRARIIGQLNSGGTWGGVLTNRTFIGGETISADAAKRPDFLDYATTAGLTPSDMGGQYGIDVNFGSAGSFNGGGVRFNAPPHRNHGPQLREQSPPWPQTTAPPRRSGRLWSLMSSPTIPTSTPTTSSPSSPVDQGRHGTVYDPNGHTVTYTPHAGFVGTDQFSTYVVTDGTDLDLAVVTVTVTEVGGPARTRDGLWSMDRPQ